MNVPGHRKAEILVESLYPPLGLLGGAPESGGKVSKLAALAAARKKKESESKAAAAPVSDVTGSQDVETPGTDQPGRPLSLLERLSSSGKPPKHSQGLGGFRGPCKAALNGHVDAPNKPVQTVPETLGRPAIDSEPLPQPEDVERRPSDEARETIRAPPSTFASIIVGETTRAGKPEPSHLLDTNKVDLLAIYGQGDLTEAFDFAGPSPDDVVLNAQSSAKGLAIRGKV